jgi:hypothetical protein
MVGLVGWPAASTLSQTALVGTAIHLLEHICHDAEQRNNEAAQSEEEANGLPKRSIAGESGLIAAADESHTAGNEREEKKRRSKDVEVTGHSFYCIALAGDWLSGG